MEFDFGSIVFVCGVVEFDGELVWGVMVWVFGEFVEIMVSIDV